MKMNGRPREVQRLAVAARRLSLPALQIEQPLVDHPLKLGAELRRDPLEGRPAALHQLALGR